MPSKRGTSIERENPFRPGGEIQKEADEILRNSTISAERVSIVDPSSPQYRRSNGTVPTPRDGSPTHEQVIISAKTDETEHVPASATALHQSSSPSNGHTPDEVNNASLTNEQTNTKLKKKKKKTCHII